jgi:hypothetical protein
LPPVGQIIILCPGAVRCDAAAGESMQLLLLVSTVLICLVAALFSAAAILTLLLRLMSRFR